MAEIKDGWQHVQAEDWPKFFFFLILVGQKSFLWATDTPVLDF